MLSLLAVYKQWLIKRPILTKATTCGVLFTIGDYLAQMCKSLKMQGQGRKWDKERTANFGVVGVLYYGPTLHLWYCKMLPRIALCFFKDRTKIFRVIGSVVFDQLLFTPVFYCGYFLIDSVVEQRDLGLGLSLGYGQIKRKMIETLLADVAIWPLATGINLWYVPIHYQVLFVNLVCLLWDVVLCRITKE